MYWDFQTQLQVKVIQPEKTFFTPHMCILIGVTTNRISFLKSVVEDLKLKRQEMPLTLIMGIQIQFLPVFSTLPNKWGESNTTHHQQNLADIMLSIQSMRKRE